MKNIKILVILMLAAFSTTSCLDKHPEDAVLADRAILNIDQADEAVIGIYSSLMSSALYSGYLTLLPDLQTDLAPTAFMPDHLPLSKFLHFLKLHSHNHLQLLRR